MGDKTPLPGQTSIFDSIDTPVQGIRPTQPSKRTKPMHNFSHPTTAQLEHMHHSIVKGLKTFFASTGLHRGVVGVSGGVDSALTLKLAVDALGAENVSAIIMPEIGLTSSTNIDHAKALCEFFGVKYHYVPINSLLQSFNTAPWKPNRLAQMNTKARVRAVLLYSYANSENAIVLGTSNKSETLLGYGTKYGDMAADVEVIGELFKTEVVSLADHVGLPPEIVNKKPSAELAPGQTDEEEIGATYIDMDKVLAHIEEGEDACVQLGFDPGLIRLVFKRYHQNAHKRSLPPNMPRE